MHKSIIRLCLTLVLFLSSFGLFGQSEKVGYFDYEYAFSELPDTKAATETLEAYSNELSNKLNEEELNLNEYYENILEKIQAGELTYSEQQKEEETIQEKQEALQNHAKEYDELLQVKEQALIAPIRQKMEQAIERVAKANNYSVVVNSSGGSTSSVVYGRDDRDVTFLVLKELGVNE